MRWSVGGGEVGIEEERIVCCFGGGQGREDVGEVIIVEDLGRRPGVPVSPLLEVDEHDVETTTFIISA